MKTLLAHQHDSDVELHLHKDGDAYVATANYTIAEEREQQGGPIWEERGTLGDVLLWMGTFWCNEYDGDVESIRRNVKVTLL